MQGDSQGGTFLQSDNWQETGNPKKKKTKQKEQNDLHIYTPKESRVKPSPITLLYTKKTGQNT